MKFSKNFLRIILILFIVSSIHYIGFVYLFWDFEWYTRIGEWNLFDRLLFFIIYCFSLLGGITLYGNLILKK